MAQIGEKIADFSFDVYYNDDIKKMRFSDFKGKWLVLLFYPADFTFVCPTELEEAAEYYDEFRKAGAEEILRKLQAAVFIHGHEGEVCPASWRPGKKTLRPDMDLIGKI